MELREPSWRNPKAMGSVMSGDRGTTPHQPPPGDLGGTHVFLQSIYFNGFQLGLSNADINAMLFLDGHPIGRLNMSFTTAKTLAKLLNEMMDTFQSATNHDVMTTEEVAAGLQKLSGSTRS